MAKVEPWLSWLRCAIKIRIKKDHFSMCFVVLLGLADAAGIEALGYSSEKIPFELPIRGVGVEGDPLCVFSPGIGPECQFAFAVP